MDESRLIFSVLYYRTSITKTNSCGVRYGIKYRQRQEHVLHRSLSILVGDVTPQLHPNTRFSRPKTQQRSSC